MRAISPVIATVIIVSVAIAISIAVALWLTGITSGFTQYENLQMYPPYAESGKYINTTLKVGTLPYWFFNFTVSKTQWWVLDTNYTGHISSSVNFIVGKVSTKGLAWKPANNTNGWVIIIQIKNTGSTTATIDNIFINDQPINQASGVVCYNGTGATLKPGTITQILIFLKEGPFTSGQSLSIRIHTASGRTYPGTVTLP